MTQHWTSHEIKLSESFVTQLVNIFHKCLVIAINSLCSRALTGYMCFSTAGQLFTSPCTDCITQTSQRDTLIMTCGMCSIKTCCIVMTKAWHKIYIMFSLFLFFFFFFIPTMQTFLLDRKQELPKELKLQSGSK